MNNNFLSIIIPTYNRSDFFEETLESIIKQNSEKWECIVVDDGSDKEHLLKIKNACNTSNKIKLFERPNSRKKGACSCRNFGAEKANSDYIVFLDSDDIIAKDFVDKRLEVIKKHSSFSAWIYPVLTFVDEVGDSNILWNQLDNGINDIDRFLNMDLPWQTTSLVWKKEFFNEIEGFDENLCAWQDWEIHLRALILDLKYIKVEQKPDIFYRKNSVGSISSEHKSITKLSSSLDAIKNIHALLDVHNLMNSKRRFLLKKRLFHLFLSISSKETGLHYQIHEYMIKSNMFSKLELNMWRYRAKTKVTFLKKCFDKVYFKIKGDHFLVTKTTFFNIISKLN